MSEYTKDYTQSTGPFKSLRERVSVAYARDGGSVNADGNGAAVDTDGYNSVDLCVVIGTRTNGAYEIFVQESDNGTSGWADIPTARVHGADSDNHLTVENNNREDEGVIMGVLPQKRYVRVRVDETTAGATGFNASMMFLLGHPYNAPTPDAF